MLHIRQINLIFINKFLILIFLIISLNEADSVDPLVFLNTFWSYINFSFQSSKFTKFDLKFQNQKIHILMIHNLWINYESLSRVFFWCSRTTIRNFKCNNQFLSIFFTFSMISKNNFFVCTKIRPFTCSKIVRKTVL